MKMRLYYVHDPMCSWCWAFRPVWDTIRSALPADVSVQRVLGGLAPDTDAPMPEAMRRKIEGIWRTIEERVPGTRFNYAFWKRCTPRRSTYPACRAVIAATRQGESFEEPMILAIQQAYYLRALNPSDEATLRHLAGEMGLDVERFGADLNAPETRRALLEEIAFARRIGAEGFPSLIAERDGTLRTLELDYSDPSAILRQIA